VIARVGALAVALLVAAPAAVSADSFTPIRMTVTIASVARLHQPLKVKVSVSADPGVLDVRDGPVAARVKLTSSECGGVFKYTTGTTLLNKALSPQPSTGQAFQGSATGSGRPTSYGEQTVCVYLEDDYQQFETDTTDYQVNVSKPCTRAAAAYDKARRRKHKPHNLASLKRKARSACGPGVPL
jgi:hypothetical protein